MEYPIVRLGLLRRWTTIAPGAVIARLDEELKRSSLRPLRDLRRTAIQRRDDEGRPRVGSASFAGSLLDEGPDWLPGLVLRMVVRPAEPGEATSPDEDSRARLQRAQRVLASALSVPRAAVEGLALRLEVLPTSSIRDTDFSFDQGSADLAALIALASFVSSRAPSGGQVFSAQLMLDGRRWLLGPIHGDTLPAKRLAVALERPGEELRVGPDTEGAGLDEFLDRRPGRVLEEVLGAGWRDAARRLLRDPVRRDMDRAWKLLRAHRAEEALEPYQQAAAQALKLGDIEALYHASQAVGVCHGRLGDPGRAVRQLQLAGLVLAGIEAADQDPGSLKQGRYQRYELEAFIGSTLHVSLGCAAAIHRMRVALDRLDLEARPDDPRWLRAVLQIAGTLARSLRATGELEEAARLYASRCLTVGLDDELARSLGDQGDTLRRSGLLDEARAHLDRAREELVRVGDEGYRGSSADFIRLHEARLALDRGEMDRAWALATKGLATWDSRRKPDARHHGLAAVRASVLWRRDPAEAEKAVIDDLGSADSPLLVWVASVPALHWLNEGGAVSDLLRKSLQEVWTGLSFDLAELEEARRGLVDRLDPDSAGLLAVRCTH